MFAKSIEDKNSTSIPPFKRIQANQANPDKTIHPPADDRFQDPALDSFSKDKSVFQNIPLFALTNVVNIYFSVNNLTIKKLKHTSAISEIKHGYQKYRMTNKAAALSPYASQILKNNKFFQQQ